MAPRRGGGGGSSIDGSGSSSSGGGGSNDDFYDPNAVLNAFRAELATSILLMVVALIALAMVLMRPWLNRDGTRNKSRLSTFVALVAALIISRAIYVANLIYIIGGSNSVADIEYDSSYQHAIRSIVVSLFAWISIVLFCILTLVEVTRRCAEIKAKRAIFEKVMAALIFAITIIALALWAMTTKRTIDIFHSGYDTVGFGSYLGLAVTLGVLIFVFTAIMMATTPAKVPSEPISKSHSSHLRLLARSFWLFSVLYLTISCMSSFSTSVRTVTIVSALSASSDVIWALTIMMVALLARDSHRAHHNPTNYVAPEVNHQQQPPVQDNSSWQKYPVVLNTTPAGTTPAYR